MKYRLINKNIAEMVEDQDFYSHMEIFKSNSAMDIHNFVDRHPKLRADNLSVITTVRGNSLTVYSFANKKWIR